MMKKIKLLLIGGFLAAGKTTMLWETARALAKRNYKVGLITNDQAPDLVDTAFLTKTGAGVREVSGSCFCCNFPGFANAIASLTDAGADFIVAEPVGSCTDLSATILQPIKDKYPEWELLPLVVLVEHARMLEALGVTEGLTHPDALYIIERQMSEADRIVLNKKDLLSEKELADDLGILRKRFPETPVTAISALNGMGVDDVLDDVLKSTDKAGNRLTDVDYDRYANGEAVLGWLNAAMDLRGKAEWHAFAENLLNALGEAFAEKKAEIGHVKLILLDGEKSIVGNIGKLSDSANCRGEKELFAPHVTLILNARVQMPREALEETVHAVVAKLSKATDVFVGYDTELCLTPGRPNPTYHYNHVV